MKRSARWFGLVAAIALLTTGALAQDASSVAPASVPASIADVITICTPVIRAELDGDKSRWGQCVGAVESYLTAVVGPPARVEDPNTEIANLVLELVKLYDPKVCKPDDTELALAIARAASFSTDADQKTLITGISQNVADCADVETGALDEPLESSTASP
jgi:hypothetical protein